MFESSRVIAARLGPLLALAMLLLGGWLLVDTLVFRSGGYYRYVAQPDSTAGEAERALLVIHDRYRPGMPNVLLLGDSRTAEGVSAKLANATVPQLNFIEAGMAGTSPRVWDYLLRRVDPDANRFAAVVLLQICDTGDSNREDLPDRSLDMSYLPPLLTWNDAFDLPGSFPDPQLRRQAWRMLLLPAQTMRDDLQQFMLAPGERIRKVRANLRAYTGARYDYTGHAEDLTSIRIDPSSLRRSPATPAPANVDSYLLRLSAARRSSGQLSEADAAYYRRWIGHIVAPGRQRRRVFAYALPRGPFHRAFGPPAHHDRSCLALSPDAGVTLLAPPAIDALERPEFYFDGLHLNEAGRERFTPVLARTLADALVAGARTP